MIDKQKAAIERCNELIKEEHSNWIGISNQVAIETVLNLIQTQQEEIEKKNKIIDEMAKELYEDDNIFGFGIFKEINTPEKIKEYFINKLEKESDMRIVLIIIALVLATFFFVEAIANFIKAIKEFKNK